MEEAGKRRLLPTPVVSSFTSFLLPVFTYETKNDAFTLSGTDY
jgi:hypothetical protein